MRSIPVMAILCLAIAACGPSGDPSQAPSPTTSTPTEGAVHNGYAEVNGLRMYYEVRGEGRPLVLLHGGVVDIDYSFAKLRPSLAKRWRTIAPEQQAHGRTADIDRPLSFEQEADDTAALLSQLNVRDADVFGWSDGGNVALALAIRHPDLVRRVAIFGTNTDNSGFKPGLLEGMRTAAAGDPAKVAAGMPADMRQAYEAIAPRPRDWPVLVNKVMVQAVGFPGWTDTQLRSIRAPVLVMVGDDDIITIEHALKVSRALLRGRIAVLPGTDHFAPVTRPDWVLAQITDFFIEPPSGPPKAMPTG